MKAIPQNNYVLCRQTNETKHQTTGTIVYEKEELPVYEIIDISRNLDDLRFNVGDCIICNSTGTKLNLKDNVQYLFNIENIVGKISS